MGLLYFFPADPRRPPIPDAFRKKWLDTAGIFSESAKEHEIGEGGKLRIASADELKSEFDPHGAHEPIKEIPEVRDLGSFAFVKALFFVFPHRRGRAANDE